MINDSDLAEMIPSALTGVTVGIGSQILLFGDMASVLIQCPFACDINRVCKWGMVKMLPQVLYFSTF